MLLWLKENQGQVQYEQTLCSWDKAKQKTEVYGCHGLAHVLNANTPTQPLTLWFTCAESRDVRCPEEFQEQSLKKCREASKPATPAERSTSAAMVNGLVTNVRRGRLSVFMLVSHAPRVQ